MKAEAYICDLCGELNYEAECVGVLTTQDIFDRLKSFPTVLRCEKAEVHLCNTCINKKALIPAQNEVNRKKDEEGYKLKLSELLYSIRSQAVMNYNQKKIKKTLHK